MRWMLLTVYFPSKEDCLNQIIYEIKQTVEVRSKLSSDEPVLLWDGWLLRRHCRKLETFLPVKRKLNTTNSKSYLQLPTHTHSPSSARGKPIMNGRCPKNSLLNFEGNTYFSTTTFVRGGTETFFVLPRKEWTIAMNVYPIPRIQRIDR